MDLLRLYWGQSLYSAIAAYHQVPLSALRKIGPKSVTATTYVSTEHRSDLTSVKSELAMIQEFPQSLTALRTNYLAIFGAQLFFKSLRHLNYDRGCYDLGQSQLLSYTGPLHLGTLPVTLRSWTSSYILETPLLQIPPRLVELNLYYIDFFLIAHLRLKVLQAQILDGIDPRLEQMPLKTLQIEKCTLTVQPANSSQELRVIRLPSTLTTLHLPPKKLNCFEVTHLNLKKSNFLHPGVEKLTLYDKEVERDLENKLDAVTAEYLLELSLRRKSTANQQWILCSYDFSRFSNLKILTGSEYCFVGGLPSSLVELAVYDLDLELFQSQKFPQLKKLEIGKTYMSVEIIRELSALEELDCYSADACQIAQLPLKRVVVRHESFSGNIDYSLMRIVEERVVKNKKYSLSLSDQYGTVKNLYDRQFLTRYIQNQTRKLHWLNFLGWMVATALTLI